MSSRTYLVPHDFSPHSDAALERAAWLAKKTGARIHLLHACAFPVHGLAPYEAVVPAGTWDAVREGAITALEELRARIAGGGIDASAEVSDHLPGTAIEEVAKSCGAELIVMGTHGRTGVSHALLGSVAERTLRTSECPVMAVKESQGGPIAKILIATDFSDHAERAVDAGADWAKKLGAELHVAHAFDLPITVITPYEVAIPDSLLHEARKEARRKLDATAERLSGRGVQATAHLLEVPAAPALADCARDVGADLLVLGTRGNTGLKHLLLGSVAERTLREAPCSVLVVHS